MRTTITYSLRLLPTNIGHQGLVFLVADTYEPAYATVSGGEPQYTHVRVYI